MDALSKGISMSLLEQAADDSLADAMLLANLLPPDRRSLVLGNFLSTFYQSKKGKRQAMLRKAPCSIIDSRFRGSYATVWYCALAEQLAYDFHLQAPAWLRNYTEGLDYENFGGGENRANSERLPDSLKGKGGAMRAFAKRNIFITENELTRNGSYPRPRESDPSNPFEMSTYRGKSLDGDYRSEWMPKYHAYLKEHALIHIENDEYSLLPDGMTTGLRPDSSSKVDSALQLDIGRAIARERRSQMKSIAFTRRSRL